TSKPPYREWTWHETKYRLGGPNFLPLPDGSLWATSRLYPRGPKTVLARLGRDTYEPVLTLPSGGDTSYARMVWHDRQLGVSYYSSHEGKSSIYLARIELPGKSTGSAPAPVTPDALREKARAVLAQLEGDIVLTGLKEPVEVLRDRWGVPHIYARNQDDLF